tara:strand:- start:111 stop:455 length:345 start_codon:yes stop_codon:yes gene_type:complete
MLVRIVELNSLTKMIGRVNTVEMINLTIGLELGDNMLWQDILKKKPSRRERKQRKYTYKVPKGVYTKPALRAKIHRRLWAKNTHGTGKYQWSGRKSQELNRLYQKAGGGFVNKK